MPRTYVNYIVIIKTITGCVIKRWSNRYTLKIYWKYTSKVYLKYTSSMLQPVELQKKKYNSSLYHFDKRSTFEAHFVKLNQYF